MKIEVIGKEAPEGYETAVLIGMNNFMEKRNKS